MKTLVFGEVIDGVLQNVTYELVACAKKLGEVVTLLTSDAECDVDSRVIKVNAGEPNPWHYKIVEKIVEREKPDLILFGNTSVSVDIASQLSAKLEVPVATGVYEVESEGEEVKAKALSYGGKVIVELSMKTPAIAVVNVGSYDAEEGKGSPNVEEVTLEELGVSDGVEFVSYIKPEEEDIDISKAEVVVSVGRGIGDEANIELAEELAELLGGVVAGSRPVIDQGWLPKSRQVGRSGKTVTGKLYIALGISGATEHVEGVKAKNVIAVNTDRTAPIFRIARCGAVADIMELVPVLIDKIREIKG